MFVACLRGGQAAPVTYGGVMSDEREQQPQEQGDISEVSGLTTADTSDDGTEGGATSDIATGTDPEREDGQADEGLPSLAEQAIGASNTDGPRRTGHDEP